MARKRKPEWVDLTKSSDGENEARAPKAPRLKPGKPLQDARNTNARAGSAYQSFQSTDDGVEFVDLSLDSELGNGEGFELYGVLSTKIVGMRFYKGCATNGEVVLVHREPGNPYDGNAIRVDNVQREQMGHIPRHIAATLAGYLDDGSLFVHGCLSGTPGAFECPINLELYGTDDVLARDALKQRMKRDRLPVAAYDSRQQELAARIAAEQKLSREKLASASNRQSDYGLGQSHHGGAPSQAPAPASMEDLVAESVRFTPRDTGKVVEKFGMGEEALAKMPMAEAPARLSTKMLPYQRQALAWMLEKENPQLPPVGSQDVVQLWKRSDRSPRIFTHIATNFSLKDTAPSLARGGILADDMGLGKTLEVISLIIADLATGSPSTATGSMATLIVAPVSVMSNWTAQMEMHVDKSNPLSVLIYHGSSRKSFSAEEITKYDVVITTYGTLAAEFMPGGKGSKAISVPAKNGLFSANWRRVVLDEGHNIRNPNTKAALAATGILAHAKWVLTGTPIINSLKDLYSLVRYIGLGGGMEQLEIFNCVLIRPLKDGDVAATLLLQALMATLCLRRRKEMSFIDLRLPPMSEYIHKVRLSAHEQEKYSALEMEAKGLLQTYQKHAGNGAQMLATYRNLLEVLLRLRQVCNHWRLCSDRISSLMQQLANETTVSLTPANVASLQALLQLAIESREDCPVCLEPLHNHSPSITSCAHTFGQPCIARVIETQHKCPMCRAELPDESVVVLPAAEESIEERDEGLDTDSAASSKITALMGILAATHTKPQPKIVVFSQWARFLRLIEPHLDAAGTSYTRIDGSMPVAARDAALRRFDSDPTCTVLLASLGVCAVGLNLVVANTVVLADSWWAPAIEDQAVDRVHRLGQKRECTVWRLVVEGSVEERTLAVQAEKRKLMGAAFGEKGEGKRGTARAADIQAILGP